MYQAVLFDMDGTILDTITDLTICTNYALSQLGKPHEFPAELVKLCYGCGIEADMQKALAMAAGCAGEDLEYVENPTPLSSYGLTAQDTARLQSIFVPYYSAHCHLHTTPLRRHPRSPFRASEKRDPYRRRLEQGRSGCSEARRNAFSRSFRRHHGQFPCHPQKACARHA